MYHMMMSREHEPTVHEGDDAGVTCSETQDLQLSPLPAMRDFLQDFQILQEFSQDSMFFTSFFMKSVKKILQNQEIS